MKKISLLIVFVITASLFALPADVFAKRELSVKINGQPVAFKNAPFIEKGRAMVPVNGVFKELGLTERWNEKDNTIWISNKYTRIQLAIGKNMMYVHRNFDFTGIPEEIKLEVAPKLVDKTPFVPLRIIAEIMGFNVVWNHNDYTVEISKGGDVIPVEHPVNYKKLDINDIKDNAVLAKWYEENYKNPGISFTPVKDKIYVLAGGGEKPTGGYTMEVDSVTMVSPGVVYITARVMKPSPDMMVTQAITYPHLLLELEAKDIDKVDGIVEVYNYDQSQMDVKYEKVESSSLNEDLQKWFDESSMIKGIHYRREGNYIYVVASAGQKATGGYSVEIMNVVSQKPDEAYVYVQVMGPEPDAVVTDVITYPAAIIRIASENIKHVGGDIKDDSDMAKTISYMGAAISAEDVKSIGLFNLEQQKVKEYGREDINKLVDYFNKAVISNDPFIEMLAGNMMSITMKDGRKIGITSYGSKTNIIASGEVNGQYITYHLVCPEIAGILLS